MAIAGAYNRFHQLIYGTDCCYLPPAGLHSWLSQIPVTSEQQLENLFVLYNAALHRNPFRDAIKVAKAPHRGKRQPNMRTYLRQNDCQNRLYPGKRAVEAVEGNIRQNPKNHGRTCNRQV